MSARPFLVPVTALVLGLAVAAAHGHERQLNWGTVKGTVVDQSGKPMPSALVYLKDSHARRLRIRPTDRNGHFNFKWTDLNLNYEIHAESADSVSGPRIIPRSDKRREIVVNLRLDKNADRLFYLSRGPASAASRDLLRFSTRAARIA